MLAAQSCPTLCNPMDRGPPGSSVHGIFPGKNAGVDSHSLLQGIFPTHGLNPRLLHGQADSLPLSCQGSLPTSWEATKPLSHVPHPHLQTCVPGTLSWGKAAVCGSPIYPCLEGYPRSRMAVGTQGGQRSSWWECAPQRRQGRGWRGPEPSPRPHMIARLFLTDTNLCTRASAWQAPPPRGRFCRPGTGILLWPNHSFWD